MTDKNREYWENGGDYNEYVCRELEDDRKEKWEMRLKKALPEGERLKILDIGCGPGFFSCLLSLIGHDVYAADRSDDMLKYAALNAKKLNVKPRFFNMDAGKLGFADETFDAVVSRNVTWTFAEPEKTYGELFRKLKKGGRLLIYDANWHLPFYDAALMKKVRENEKRYKEKFGAEMKVYADDTSIFDTLPLSNTVRPKWDADVLKETGFSDVQHTEDVGCEVYAGWERELYSATPMFEIIAVK